MTGTRPAEILKHLEQTGGADAELLARFVVSKDAAAFAELVRRHAALVLGVCQRVSGHPQDAEDAFQATFLILAQKAAGVRDAALLANWLYGVAFRVARRTRRSAQRRSAREVTVATMPDPPAPPRPDLLPDLGPILDEELAALPKYYRDAVVLCDLRGASRAAAASALGIPEGTLSSRLAAARKRLAARLARRGLALSVVALPLALSEAQAATAASNELVLRTVRLVTDCAAGGAVPGPLARLIEGGIDVRKTFVLGAVLVVAVAGAVFAARPADPPPGDPPKPPAVADRAPEAQPKDELKPGEKPAPKFTTTPKLQMATDVKVREVREVAWSRDGNLLALQGIASDGKRGFEQIVIVSGPPNLRELQLPKPVEETGRLVGFAPDGQTLLTDVRESRLLSGFHRLRSWNVRLGDAPAFSHRLTVDLEATEAHGYAFAADGKTYRTVVERRDGRGTLEILEADAATGKTVKSMLKVDRGACALSETGARLAVISPDATRVAVYDLDRGAKVSEYTFPPDNPTLPVGAIKGEILARPPDTLALVFSPDGRRLVVSRGLERIAVLDTVTGTALAELEGTAGARLTLETGAFTADGRLLAARGQMYKISKRAQPGGTEQTYWSPDGQALFVWDTQTGKALKTWRRSAPVVAFNPVRPLLASFEPNGEGVTRIGFWDFAAEVEKK